MVPIRLFIFLREPPPPSVPQLRQKSRRNSILVEKLDPEARRLRQVSLERMKDDLEGDELGSAESGAGSGGRRDRKAVGRSPGIA